MRSQFSALMSARLSEFKYSFTAAFNKSNSGRKSKNPKKSGSKGSIILIALLMIYLVGYFSAMFYMLFSGVAEPYHALQLDWLYFTLYAAADFLLMFIGTIFITKSQLFEAKDNEQLLAMPINPRLILTSRMCMLIGMNVLSGLPISVTAMAAWIIKCGFNGVQFILFIIISLAIPLFTTAVAAFFGWLLSLVTRRIRHKAMFTMILSVILFGLYFSVISRINDLLTMLADGAFIAGKLRSIVPLYMIGSAMGDMNILHFIAALLMFIIPFLVCCIVLSATFIKTVTANRGFAKVAYHERRVARKSALSALYRRELARLLSSPAYLMNSGLGTVMTFAAGVMLCIFGDAVPAMLAQLGLPSNVSLGLITVSVCMISSMTMISSSSVSLEGKNLWIVQSLPVHPSLVLKSKLLLHLSFSVPSTLMVSAGIIAAFRPRFVDAIFVVIFPLTFSLAAAVFGLAMNLRFPVINWTNETQAVKNSTAVMLAMLVPWVVSLALNGLAVLLLGFMPFPLVFTVLFVIVGAAAALIYRWILRRGVQIFSQL